jgi:hypothetical protein
VVIGQTIPHYRIVENGGGAWGVVYEAEDMRLNPFVFALALESHLRIWIVGKVSGKNLDGHGARQSRARYPHPCRPHRAERGLEGFLGPKFRARNDDSFLQVGGPIGDHGDLRAILFGACIDQKPLPVARDVIGKSLINESVCLGLE